MSNQSQINSVDEVNNVDRAKEMQKLITIDLKKILRSRMPHNVSRFVPDWGISILERLIHQKELNEMLRVAYPKEGSDFSNAILNHLDISVEVSGLDAIRQGRYVFASNHPLGGLDGIAFIKVLGEKYGDENIRFLVNDMLMNVAPLRNVFLPINKYGSQGRSAGADINAAYESQDKQILIFPAGIVSRLHPDGKIRDLEWKPNFVKRALSSGRAIVPVKFIALNSQRFYRIARLRKKFNIKVNLEQALLPGELCKCHGKHFRIIFGTPIPPEELRKMGKTPAEITAAVRKRQEELSC